MNFQFNITADDYPLIFKFKKKEREEIISKIFKLGYECYFPTNNIFAWYRNN